jgi:hypothetical protein
MLRTLHNLQPTSYRSFEAVRPCVVSLTFAAAMTPLWLDLLSVAQVVQPETHSSVASRGLQKLVVACMI